MVIAGDQTVERGARGARAAAISASLELQAEPPALVDVCVRGSSDTLSRVGPGDIVAVLDLGAARPGRRFPAHRTGAAPFGVEVVAGRASTVVFVFEPTAVKQLPIRPSVEGDLVRLRVGATTVDPPMVEITGPRRR